MPNPAIYSPESSDQSVVSNQETQFSISSETTVPSEKVFPPTTSENGATSAKEEVTSIAGSKVVDERESTPEVLHALKSGDPTTAFSDKTETEFINGILEVENETK